MLSGKVPFGRIGIVLAEAAKIGTLSGLAGIDIVHQPCPFSPRHSRHVAFE